MVSQDGRQRPVEYFTTQIEAEIFAADYNKMHHHTSLSDHKMTFAELYHRWLPRHIADTDPSLSTLTLDKFVAAWATINVYPTADCMFFASQSTGMIANTALFKAIG